MEAMLWLRSVSPPPLLLLARARSAPPHFLTKLHVTPLHSFLPLFRRSAFIFSRPPTAGRALCFATGAGAALQDAGATALVLAGAYALVLAFDELSKRNVIEQIQSGKTDDVQNLYILSYEGQDHRSLSRKVVHVLSGLLFMSSWPFFSYSAEARYFAAVVPLVNCLRLIIYGLRLVNDEGLIKSVTREGKPEELLRGPLYYVIVLMFCALVFWRESPVGVVSLAMMSGGDGFADIMGRRYGAMKLPYNRQKSWIGSISMFIFGFIFSIGMLYYFSSFGLINLDLVQMVGKVAVVSLVATIVESLPVTEFVDDNISVPLSTVLSGFLVFGLGPNMLSS